MSVPELLRARLLGWLPGPALQPGWNGLGDKKSEITRSEVLAALDEQRGPWPDAGR